MNKTYSNCDKIIVCELFTSFLYIFQIKYRGILFVSVCAGVCVRADEF